MNRLQCALCLCCLEEVFVSNEGMWWSPTAKYLAYVQINDTEVQAIEYTMYGSGQYPTTMIVPYPKVQKHIFFCFTHFVVLM